jgi:hypothetical protein
MLVCIVNLTLTCPSIPCLCHSLYSYAQECSEIPVRQWLGQIIISIANICWKCIWCQALAFTTGFQYCICYVLFWYRNPGVSVEKMLSVSDFLNLNLILRIIQLYAILKWRVLSRRIHLQSLLTIFLPYLRPMLRPLFKHPHIVI